MPETALEENYSFAEKLCHRKGLYFHRFELPSASDPECKYDLKALWKELKKKNEVGKLRAKGSVHERYPFNCIVFDPPRGILKRQNTPRKNRR